MIGLIGIAKMITFNTRPTIPNPILTLSKSMRDVLKSGFQGFAPGRHAKSAKVVDASPPEDGDDTDDKGARHSSLGDPEDAAIEAKNTDLDGRKGYSV